MKTRVEELIDEAGLTAVYEMFEPELLKFSHLILQECTDVLKFHGFEDAVTYIDWMAINEFGVVK